MDYHLFKKATKSKNKIIHRWYYYFIDPVSGKKIFLLLPRLISVARLSMRAVLSSFYSRLYSLYFASVKTRALSYKRCRGKPSPRSQGRRTAFCRKRRLPSFYICKNSPIVKLFCIVYTPFRPLGACSLVRFPSLLAT